MDNYPKYVMTCDTFTQKRNDIIYVNIPEFINRFLYKQQHTKKSFEIKAGCIYAGKVKKGNKTKRVGLSLVAGVYKPEAFWDKMKYQINSWLWDKWFK